MRYRYLAVLIGGAGATVIQTVMIRESIMLFGGYELVSGLLLFGWLFWNAIGSLVYSRFRPQNADPFYAGLLIATSFLALLTITGLRFSIQLFGIGFGHIVNIEKMFLITTFLLAPLCFFNGALFPAACRMLDVPRVYCLEGVGAFAGGLILTFIMTGFLSSYAILIIMATAVSVIALLLLKNARYVFIPALLISSFFFAKDVEFQTRQQQMRGQELVVTKESRYGSIAVTRTNGQYNFYAHGFFDFALPDRFTSEEAVQYAMLLHDKPTTVLLIGAGVASSVENILMHSSIAKITYIELDPTLVDQALKFTDNNWVNDDRVEIRYGDARRIMKATNNLYDVIILNLPEPANIMLNRYYTVEFFDLARNRINSGGVFSLKISAPIDIIDAGHGQMLSSIYGSLKQAFKSVTVLPASKAIFICTDEPINIYDEPISEILLRNLETRNLELGYVNAGSILYNLTDARISYLYERINTFKGRVNRDLEPVCYYYATLLWSGTSHLIKEVFAGCKNWLIWFIIVPVVVLLIIIFRRMTVYLSILSVGASAIIAEIMALILFQIAYGYMYGWIGMLIACFMLGLSLGAFFYLKYLKQKDKHVLSYLHWGMALLFIFQIGFAFFGLPLARLFLPMFLFFFGICGGIYFPVAINILSPKRAGIAYAFDLFGAGLGAILVSVFLIPHFGLIKIMGYLVGLNLLLGIVLIVMRKSYQS